MESECPARYTVRARSRTPAPPSLPLDLLAASEPLTKTHPAIPHMPPTRSTTQLPPPVRLCARTALPAQTARSPTPVLQAGRAEFAVLHPPAACSASRSR